MHARNRKTGSPIKGTSEQLPACSNVSPGRFSRTESGEIDFEHDGYTEVYWNGAHTLTDQRSHVLFLDEAGEEVSGDEIELYDEPEAADAEAAG